MDKPIGINVDWERATVTVRAPVAFTATEEVQEFEMPLANLWAMCEQLGHMALKSIEGKCARCSEQVEA